MASTLPEWVRTGPRRFRVERVTKDGELQVVVPAQRMEETSALALGWWWCKQRDDTAYVEVVKVRADDSERVLHRMERGPRGGVKHIVPQQ